MSYDPIDWTKWFIREHPLMKRKPQLLTERIPRISRLSGPKFATKSGRKRTCDLEMHKSAGWNFARYPVSQMNRLVIENILVKQK